MLLDARDLPEGSRLCADVCIVGAGAAGIAMAVWLARQAQAPSVIVLESGDGDGGPQVLQGGDPGPELTRLDPQYLSRSRQRRLGGSTNCWGGWCRPLDEVDLEARPGVAGSGWPIALDDLAPHYRRALELCSLVPEPGFDDAASWAAAAGLRPLELSGGPLRNVIFQGIEDASRWRFRDMYGQVLAESARVRLVLGANVLGLRTSGRRVVDLEAATVAGGRAGRRLEVQAADYVLAQGGLETVRLLLLSGLGPAPALGRCFMVHPVLAGVARVTFPTELPDEVARLYTEQTLLPVAPGAPPVAFEPQPSLEGALRAPAVTPPFVLAPPRPLRRVRFWAALAPTRAALGEGLGNFRILLHALDARRYLADVGWEQVPHPENRISLEPRPDPVFGQPRLRIDWRLLPQDEATLRGAVDLLSRQMRRLGAVTAPEIDLRRPWSQWPALGEDGPRFLWPGDHHLGGARMSREPGACVDANGRVVGTDNLHLASSATFPTGGFANPTLTVLALALRLADRLAGSRSAAN